MKAWSLHIITYFQHGCEYKYVLWVAGANTTLVVGGGANSLDGGADPIYFIDFLKKTYEIKEIMVRRVGGGRLFRSATEWLFPMFWETHWLNWNNGSIAWNTIKGTTVWIPLD